MQGTVDSRTGAGPQCAGNRGWTALRTYVRILEEETWRRTDQRRPIVLRHGTVLTMDADHRVLTDADVLVVDGLIAAVGEGVEAPPGAREIDASGGIVMPGMIDTHRHLWQTAMRGYGADWTLTQYFVWYYLEHGRKFRPEDIYAGNLLGAIEAIDAGVTTTVDWSHGLQTVEHAAAAVEALQEVPAPVRAGVRKHPGGAVGVDGAAGGPSVPGGAQAGAPTTGSGCSWRST